MLEKCEGMGLNGFFASDDPNPGKNNIIVGAVWDFLSTK